MRKAFCYFRVSSEGQLKGDGPKRQRDKVKRYCKANGIEIVRIYEEAITGTKHDRPELARMMVDLETNGHGINTVLIERLDRLARDLMVQEAIIKDLRKIGVKLISVDDGDDLAGSDPTRKLVRQVLGAIAEYEKEMLVLKLRAARERKRKRTGKCEGERAYGEDSLEERKVITRIRLLRRRKKDGMKGRTYQEIADLLNSEDVPTKRGKKWNPALVYHICHRGKRR